MVIEKGISFGPYVIVECIGTGAMGEVYRARDSRLGRDVAVKVLARNPTPDALARFRLEAESTAVLAHPNIVTVFDVGDHEGLPFLVSELLEGETLRQRLARGALEPQEALGIALQIGRGVIAAHALRIIHRDLKPENVFITKDGTVKILDFGLVKLKPHTHVEPDAMTLDASEPGKVFGTPAYMAPEQVRGEPVDERADIFALGTILYEMLSKNPFRRKTGIETLAAILNEDPPPLATSADVPSSIESLIFRCMEKNPGERFQTARDVTFIVESLMGESRHGVQERPRSHSQKTAPSIAVLPFVDMSPGRDQDYLCEGIAEELINVLTRIEGLRVAARSSSFQFRGAALDIRAVGARLGVATVLEGGVRKAGENLRVTVQLVDVAAGYQRWSQRFEGKLDEVFTIQDEIAESVATALRGVLTHREKEVLRQPEARMETYEYLLRGRQLMHRFNRASLESAKLMFERAVELESGYAPPYTGLADVHSWLYEWWGGGEADLEAADRASRMALHLGPNLAEAHTSRGFVLSLLRRYDQAATQFEEAITLNPSSYDAHYYYARTCFASGRIERSAELFRRAGTIRQEDYQSMILLDQSLRVLGRNEEAREALREGILRVERQLELDPNDARALSLGANALYIAGRKKEAICWSGRALELHPDDSGVLINGACLRALVGLKEEALDLLERTFAKGFGKRDWIEHDPDYDSLRDDPRFQALLDKLP